MTTHNGNSTAIIRPDMDELSELQGVLATKHAPHVRYAIRYIEFLEQRLRETQEQESLSLTTLRTERDQLKKQLADLQSRFDNLDVCHC